VNRDDQHTHTEGEIVRYNIERGVEVLYRHTQESIK